MTTRGRIWTTSAAAVAVLIAIGVWMMMPRATTTEVAVPEVTPAEFDAFAGTTVLFGHQSVGANVLDGIAGVYADAGRAAPVVADATNGVGAADGASIVHAFVGVNGDPLGKFAAFRALVDGPAGDAASVAIVKLCYTDITSDTDPVRVFEEYRALMADLEARHPDITFLYATVPLTTDRSLGANIKALFGSDDRMGPADNRVRAQYNALIRAQYADSGRLFDIAAVESTMSTDPAVRTLDGEEYHVLNSALSADAGHLDQRGGRVVAAEMIRIVAGLRS
ncbi:SGNH/GDSL hydrolase family protein [Microbacterium paludicola]|uniref:SGNH/GDSL hydrolase family protein n=1 Tax=Microbacterium paludicola TaxID=300019 RepID=UPI00119F71C4|nr:SGNH/GDSL hydrolase family protein [Microbacterium paludicola]